MSTTELVTKTKTYTNDYYDPRETIDGRPNAWYDPAEFHSYDKPVCYVGVYAVTRHYGGAEEGGWWYNISEHVLSIPLITPGDADEIEEVRAFLGLRFQDEGNIYSVRGGVRYHFVPEVDEGEEEDVSRPRYE